MHTYIYVQTQAYIYVHMQVHIYMHTKSVYMHLYVYVYSIFFKLILEVNIFPFLDKTSSDHHVARLGLFLGSAE